MLFLLVFGGYKVKANSNGIGTIKDTYSREILEGVTYTYTESSNGKPQKNYVLEYNPKNAAVEALAVYGKYAYVMKNGKVGWIKSDRVKKVNR